MEKDKIELGVCKYYIPQRWSGCCSKIAVNKFINNEFAEVVTKKGETFRIRISNIYTSDKAAINGCKKYAQERKTAAQTRKAKKEATNGAI